ncbi:MAG: hypothetical protein J6A94_09750 [Lachnospiraceae bacterium]|nr:hypothetical protein [Lachnospiraceae bacterium]
MEEGEQEEMKCESCGGNLTLEETKCPYCGSLNKHAQKHVQDMYRYQGEFQNTQSKINKVTSNYTGFTVRAGIIAILLVIMIVFIVLGAQSYEINSAINRAKAKGNFKKYSAIMDEYIAEEDYLGFSAFWDSNDIDYYDSPYEKYYPIMRACQQYAYLYDSILSAYSGMQKEYRYEGEEERYIDNIAYHLDYFYDALDPQDYAYYEGADSEENMEAVAKIEENVKALLHTYCGLTEEDLEGWDNLSGAKRIVLIEERMLNGK